MKIPHAFTLDGRTWKVVLKPLATRGLYGQCIHTKRRIEIDCDLPDDEREEVFLHELIHACLPERWNSRAEERMVLRLAPRLLKALQDMGAVE